METIQTVEPLFANDPPEPEEHQAFTLSEVEDIRCWNTFTGRCAKGVAQLMIDSLTQLCHPAPDDYQFRERTLRLIDFLDGLGC